MSVKPLLNQRAFITGGSKGIGNAIANKLSSLGCKITILSRNEELLEREVKQLNSKYPLINGELHDYVKFDLNEINSIEKVIKVNQSFNESNILINCAGLSQNKLMMTIPSEEIMRIININLTSSMILSKLFIKNISRIKNNAKYNANIINISSVVSISSNNLIGACVYSASKAALTRFTETLSEEQIQIHKRRPRSPLIRVNALLPRHVSNTEIGRSVQQTPQTLGIGTTDTNAVANAVGLILCDGSVCGEVTVC
ncbi:hypothetical protein C6P42_001458 [Pichia californica]|nr:hypothetical protein C6P42_001458 [[Candida] californica]